MQATLTNLAPLPRSHWASVTFPRALAATFGTECTFDVADGRQWRAVRGRSIGLKTVYRIFCHIEGSQTLEGALVNTPHPSAGHFGIHPWVADDVKALIPSFRVDGPDRSELISTKMIDSSAAHQRWLIKRQTFSTYLSGAFTLEWWADILAWDPVMPIRGKLVWSDRQDADMNRTFINFVLSAGEFIAFDFAVRNGSMTPAWSGGEWHTLLNDRPLTLVDGSGLPLSGNMLCFVQPQSGAEVPDPEDLSHWEVQAIRNLQAGAFGDIVGVSHDWGGHYGAHGNVPRFNSGYQSKKEEEWQRFQAWQQVPAGWFARRTVAIGGTPAMTGDQEDFGAVKGTYAVTELDPRFIQVYQDAVYSELFRGFNHYEEEGTPLDLDKHPDWVTWNGVTHYSVSVSPDRLGKDWPIWVPAPGTDWRGYDDQHRSQLNLAAYMMLTDDPLADDLLAHQVTTDRASYRVKFPEKGTGSTRAQGRTMGTWAQFLTVTDGDLHRHFAEMIGTRIEASVSSSSMNVSGPIKVLSWDQPDGRKPVFDEDGKLAPYTSVWEHGIAAARLYGVVKRHPDTDAAREVLTKVCELLANYGFFKEGGNWYTVDDMWYRDGEELPGGMTSDSRHLVSRVGIGGVASWTFAGILVAREFLGSSHPQWANMNNYIRAITGGAEAMDRRTAEWWAAVESIQTP
jgi:hypothetical protein